MALGLGPLTNDVKVTSWQGIRLLCELLSVVSLGGGLAGVVKGLCFVLF